MTPSTFTSRRDVELALNSAQLEPPPRPASMLPGATAELRDSMARFSLSAAHQQRRCDVVAAVDGLDVDRVRSAAFERTAAMLTGGRIDAVADLAARVPTETLCAVLDLDAESPQILADTLAIVEVIGRGEPSTESSDAAASRLLDRFRSHPLGAVPVVSMLYQNHDATASLIATTIVARHQGTRRRSAVIRTLRVAALDTEVGDTPVPTGTTVVLDLEQADLEFGAGRHRCPGRQIAEAIVEGIMAALTSADYHVVLELAVFDDAGRARTLLMEPA